MSHHDWGLCCLQIRLFSCFAFQVLTITVNDFRFKVPVSTMSRPCHQLPNLRRMSFCTQVLRKLLVYISVAEVLWRISTLQAQISRDQTSLSKLYRWRCIKNQHLLLKHLSCMYICDGKGRKQRNENPVKIHTRNKGNTVWNSQSPTGHSNNTPTQHTQNAK